MPSAIGIFLRLYSGILPSSLSTTKPIFNDKSVLIREMTSSHPISSGFSCGLETTKASIG